MKKLLFILLMLVSISSFSQEAMWYHKCSDTILNREYFIICYNKAYKVPNWVSYKMTAHMESNDTIPRTDHFKTDSLIKKFSAHPGDYTNSGYQRGHLCSAEDMAWSEASMHKTFIMTNVAPQNGDLNEKSWYYLEEKVRKWAISEGSVYVTSGTIVEKKHKTIKNNVAVPSYFYKIVLVEKDMSYKMIAFLFKNEGSNNTLQEHVVSVNYLESVTGIDFYPELPDGIEDALESSHEVADWKF